MPPQSMTPVERGKTEVLEDRRRPRESGVQHVGVRLERKGVEAGNRLECIP